MAPKMSKFCHFSILEIGWLVFFSRPQALEYHEIASLVGLETAVLVPKEVCLLNSRGGGGGGARKNTYRVLDQQDTTRTSKIDATLEI